jgi:hypothetical protein
VVANKDEGSGLDETKMDDQISFNEALNFVCDQVMSSRKKGCQKARVSLRIFAE